MATSFRVPFTTRSNVSANPLLASKARKPLATTKESSNILGLEPFWARSASVISPPQGDGDFLEAEEEEAEEESAQPRPAESCNPKNDENVLRLIDYENLPRDDDSNKEIEATKSKKPRIRTRVSVVVRVRPVIVSRRLFERALCSVWGGALHFVRRSSRAVDVTGGG